MISLWHLFWICPGCVFIGLLVAGLLQSGREADRMMEEAVKDYERRSQTKRQAIGSGGGYSLSAYVSVILGEKND